MSLPSGISIGCLAVVALAAVAMRLGAALRWYINVRQRAHSRDR